MKKNIMIPRWYIATTIIGSEESIYSSLLDKIKAYGFNDLVQEMRIIKYNDITIETFKDGSNPPPKTMRNSKNIVWETTPDGRYIKKTSKVFNKFPGYLFICMIMTEEVWYTIRNTPGITGFVGSSGKGAQPIPISEFELQELFDPDKNKDIIRHINASSISIEEVEHVVEENPIQKAADVEFFNSRAVTSTVLSATRKIDFENRQTKNDNNVDGSLTIEDINDDLTIEKSKDEKINKEIPSSVSEIIQEDVRVNTNTNDFVKSKEETKPIVKEKTESIQKDSANTFGEFVVGNTIKIIDGSFIGETAIIIRIDVENQNLICQLDLFGRNMEVKLKKNQIEK